MLTITPGQRISYVTDAADTPANVWPSSSSLKTPICCSSRQPLRKGMRLLAAERAHLTTAAAGTIAREVGVRRVEPFHFSPRYAGEEESMLNEVIAALPEDVREEQARPGWHPSGRSTHDATVGAPDSRARISPLRSGSATDFVRSMGAAYAALFSSSAFHCPRVARPFIRARCEKARCAAATFSDLPDQIFCGAC